MKGVSGRYREKVEDAGREFVYKARVELKNGEVLELDGHDILLNGLRLSCETSGTGALEVGSVSAAGLELYLNNYTGRFKGIQIGGATIRPSVGLVVEKHWERGDTPEWVDLGVFIADDADMRGRTVVVEAYDNMVRFDRPYRDSHLSYPASLREILEDCCDTCGIMLRTREFPNSGYIVQERPEDEALNCRDVVRYVAQLAGRFARMDVNGALELAWYGQEEGACKTLYGVTELWEQDITITGVCVASKVRSTDEEGNGSLVTKEYLCGEEGYVMEIRDNPLAQGEMETQAGILGGQLNGFTYRPYTYTGQSDPAAEAGDVVMLVDKDGNTCRSIVTSLCYTSDSNERYTADGATAQEKNSTRYSAGAKLVAALKEQVQERINVYDTYAKSFAAMAAATVGYYTTKKEQDDGSVISYAHNKPVLEESEIQWKQSGNVLAVSNDYGKTWKGIDKDGNALLESLAAKTIVADKIVSGRMQTADGRFYIDLDKGESTATKLISSFQYSNDYPKRKFTVELGQDDDWMSYGMLLKTEDNTRMAFSVPATTLPPIMAVMTEGNRVNTLQFNGTALHLTTENGGLHIDDTKSTLYSSLYIEDELEVGKGLTVYGGLDVWDGPKNRVVTTTKGRVRVAAYETAEPYFGDIGEGVTDETGKARVAIEPLFAETVNTGYAYQVFLQPYAEGDFWVAKRNKKSFVVQGPPNSKFAYEIKARQKGYEETRLEQVEESEQQAELRDQKLRQCRENHRAIRNCMMKNNGEL